MEFLTQGTIIKLLRYKITYIEKDEIRYALTEEEAKDIATVTGGTVTKLDTTADEWIDGIDVAPTNMPYDKAKKIAAMGEQGYREYVETKRRKDPEVMLSMIDYLSMMSGIEMPGGEIDAQP